MAKPATVTSPSNGASSTALSRMDRTPGDERPFAEVRKTLQDVLRMVSIHRWVFFVPFCIVASGAFILSLYYPRTYSASTTFERRNDPIMVDLPMTAGAASFKYFRSTLSRDLTSEEYMAEALEHMGLCDDFDRNEDGTLTEKSLARRNAMAGVLGSRISVSAQSPNAHIDIIRLGYTGPDPDIGRRALDAAKHVYIKRTMKWIHEFLISQRDYFQREAVEVLDEIKAIERVKTKLKLEYPLINPLDPSGISSRLAQLEVEQRDLQRRRREYVADAAALRQMLASTAPGTPKTDDVTSQDRSASVDTYVSSQAANLVSEIQATDKKITMLRRTRGMTYQHPEIVELLGTRDWLEKRLAEQRAKDRAVATKRPSDPPGHPLATAATPPWQGERAKLLVKLEAVQDNIKHIDISLASNNEALHQLRKAKGELFERQEEHEEIAAKLAKTRNRYSQLQATLAKIEPPIKMIEQGRLMSFDEGHPARGSSIPVNPKAKTILVLAILAGIAAGVIFVVLAEVLDHIYRTSGQVARSLGLPILDTIDEIVTSRDRRRKLIRSAVVVPAMLTCCVGVTVGTGSLAYLSIQRPWTYERIRSIPQAALDRLAFGDDADKAPKEGPEVDVITNES